jgi:hypothetical protein
MSEIKDDGLRNQGSTAVTHLCPIHGWQGIHTYAEKGPNGGYAI